jgi:hypothetical protein
MGFWWVKSAQQRLSRIQRESTIQKFQLPEKVKLPKIEVPKEQQ